MIFFPAIDLKNGRCVRLLRGRMDKATVFNDNPNDQAHKFRKAGVKWLHVVDLDGAFEGKPVNGAAIEKMLANTDLSLQIGGGIRNMATIDTWLDKGVRRVILGTVALYNPNLVKQACKRYPGHIAIGVDAHNGFVAVEGWAKVSSITAKNLALKLEDMGAAVIIYTDISRDGAMQGPNIEETLKLAESISIPTILSGGVSSMADLKAIKTADKNQFLDGVIVGRALYDGRIDPVEAQSFLDA